MRKKEYIEKAKTAILNRVRFHAPILHSDKIEAGVLARSGINPQLPIFKFEKPLSKALARAFSLALQEENFNLVICAEALNAATKKAKPRKLYANLLNRAVVFQPQSSSKMLLEMINKLNINYPSASNYNVANKEKFFKVGGKILNPRFEDFALVGTDVIDNCLVQYCEFALNGDNFFVKVQNKESFSKPLTLELNLPLAKGYYFFKRLTRAIMIENLMTKQKLFLNFLCRNAKFSFSNVDGLENSIYSCVNAKLTLNLKPGEETFVFFNFGQGQFVPKNSAQVVRLVQLSKNECYKTFNVRVLTKNPKFDLLFNKTLPQRIWVDWMNGENNEQLQQRYISYKKLFVRGDAKFRLVNFKEIGLRELGIFNGKYYKKIVVLQGNEQFMRVGKTFFYNVDGITNKSLQSTNPIAVCFGA